MVAARKNSPVMPTSSPLQVLIGGGGVAGLEALLALRDLAGEQVELSLLSPEAEFVYRPMAVAEPFGRGRAAHHALKRIVADAGAELVEGALAKVDADARVAVTAVGIIRWLGEEAAPAACEKVAQAGP
jgi:NADH dehydrogenase FAD-containing subunit